METSLKQKNFLEMVEYKLLSLSESKQERDADAFGGGKLGTFCFGRLVNNLCLL